MVVAGQQRREEQVEGSEIRHSTGPATAAAKVLPSLQSHRPHSPAQLPVHPLSSRAQRSAARTSWILAGRYCFSVSLVRLIMYCCARPTSCCCAAVPCSAWEGTTQRASAA